MSRLKSHLLQMRGLKPVRGNSLIAFGVSHLLQMRGLKLSTLDKTKEREVASFTDAWIETPFGNGYKRSQ